MAGPTAPKPARAAAVQAPPAAPPVAAAAPPVAAAAPASAAVPATQAAPRVTGTGLVRPAAKTAAPAQALSTPSLLRRLRLFTVGFQVITTVIGAFAVALHVDAVLAAAGTAEELATGPLTVIAVVIAALAILSLLVVIVIAARRTHRVVNPWHIGAIAADTALIVELTAMEATSAVTVILVILTGIAAVTMGLAGFQARLVEYQ